MSKIISTTIALLFSIIAFSQSKDSSQFPHFSLTTEGDSLSIVIHQEKIKIPKKKIDSLYKASIKKIKTELNSKETKANFNKSVRQAEGKMTKIIDALVDDKGQKQKLKSELTETFKNSSAQIDSLFSMFNSLILKIEDKNTK